MYGKTRKVLRSSDVVSRRLVSAGAAASTVIRRTAMLSIDNDVEQRDDILVN